MEQKIKTTYIFGIIGKDNKKALSAYALFPDNFHPTTTVKSIKIWYGLPKNHDIKSILGLKIKYINYITGETKDTECQGAILEEFDYEIKS